MKTTRRFPRTLAEAFPAERACAIERPPPRVPRLDRYAGIALAVLIGVSLTLVVVSRLG